jgi:hypothetical protein
MRMKLFIRGLELPLRVKGGHVSFGSRVPGDFGCAKAQVLGFEAATVQKHKCK